MVIQDVVADAVAFARKVVAEGRALIRVRDRSEKLVYDEKAFNEAAGNLTKRARGLEAPMACVEAVRNALTLPFDEGIEARARAVHEAGHRRSVQIPAAYLLRRTRGAESARHARHDQGARRVEGGGDRRGHDGRRHRHVLRQCRHPRHHDRDGTGGAGPRPRRHREELPRHGGPGRHDARAGREAFRPDQGRDRPGSRRRCRS